MIKPIIPDEILKQHLAVLGKTGSGKSSALRTLVEACLLDLDKPFIGIDPKGDWWGLKSSASGKRAGYPIVIFGGLHADVPINARAGAHIAELLATGNRPAIIDLSQMLIGERTRFFIDFAESLFRHTRGMRWLMIDEVHNFAPKGKVFSPEAGMMLHWANKLASEGRGKGIQLMVASQRPQKVHNDLLDSCETLIAMRSVHPRAREAIKEWIDGAGDPERGAEVLGSLARMPRGTGWVWSPEIGFGPKEVTFPMFRTFDSFKPQLHGSDKKLQGWASVDLKEVREKLADVVKEAEANDPSLLKREIADLKKKLAQPVATVINPGTDGKKYFNDGHVRGYANGERDGRADLAHSLLNELKKIEDTIHATVGRLVEIRRAAVKTIRHDHGVASIMARQLGAHDEPANHREHLRVHTEARKPIPAADGKIPAGQLKILTAVAQRRYDGASREYLTVMTGYKRSSRDTYIQRLREAGLVSTNGELVVVTPSGEAAAGDYEPLPSGGALIDWWRNRLPEGERKVLDVVVHHGTVEREEIGAQTGYKRSSRDTYLQRLRTRGVVKTSGTQVSLSEHLQ